MNGASNLFATATMLCNPFIRSLAPFINMPISPLGIVDVVDYILPNGELSLPNGDIGTETAVGTIAYINDT